MHGLGRVVGLGVGRGRLQSGWPSAGQRCPGCGSAPAATLLSCTFSFSFFNSRSWQGRLHLQFLPLGRELLRARLADEYGVADFQSVLSWVLLMGGSFLESRTMKLFSKKL